MLDTTDKMIEPKTYVTKYYITLEDLGFLDKKYEVGKLIPIQFNIESYWETRYVNKGFTIKLNK
jgi:hypothetical protein